MARVLKATSRCEFIHVLSVSVRTISLLIQLATLGQQKNTAGSTAPHTQLLPPTFPLNK